MVIKKNLVIFIQDQLRFQKKKIKFLDMMSLKKLKTFRTY